MMMHSACHPLLCTSSLCCGRLHTSLQLSRVLSTYWHRRGHGASPWPGRLEQRGLSYAREWLPASSTTIAKQSSSPQSLKPSSPPATESPATSHPPQTAPTTTSDSSAAPALEPTPQAASPGAETSAGNAPSASEPSAELTLRKRSRTTSPNYGLRKKQSTSKNTLRITSVGRSRTLRIATRETRLSLSLYW